MDEQGIEKALMFPAAAHDIEYEFADNIPALYANIRAFNRWMLEEVGYNVENRMFLPPYIALADPDLAVKELERSWRMAPRSSKPSPDTPTAARTNPRRPIPRRPHLRPLLVDRQRSRHPPRRPPRRHRLPEIRSRLVRRPPGRLWRLRRLPMGHVLGGSPGHGADRRPHPPQLLRPLPQHQGLPLGDGHRLAPLHPAQDGPRLPHGPQSQDGPPPAASTNDRPRSSASTSSLPRTPRRTSPA